MVRVCSDLFPPGLTSLHSLCSIQSTNESLYWSLGWFTDLSVTNRFCFSWDVNVHHINRAKMKLKISLFLSCLYSFPSPLRHFLSWWEWERWKRQIGKAFTVVPCLSPFLWELFLHQCNVLLIYWQRANDLFIPSQREIWVLLMRSGWIILVLIEAKECQDEAIGLFEVCSRSGIWMRLFGTGMAIRA